MFETALEINENELQKFTKILELTTSDNDSEALAAARKARKILAKYNINYQILLDKLQKTPNYQYCYRIRELEAKVKQQQDSISQLQKTKAKDKSEPLKFFGPIQALKKFMIKNLTLQNHERTILEDLKEIQPKSKEAYLVLICARRHGIDYRKTSSE